MPGLIEALEECWHNKKSAVWIIILAAGFSKRMGAPKILLPYHDGSLIRHVVQKATQAGAAGVIVVANPHFSDVINHIGGDQPVRLVWNDLADLGMSTSLIKGIESLPSSASAAVILLADQPEIEPAVIQKIIDEYSRSSASIIQAAYEGVPGHPVLFDRKWFPELLKSEGDQGGRNLIKTHADKRQLVYVSSSPPEDIDNPEDYLRLKRRAGVIHGDKTNR